MTHIVIGAGSSVFGTTALRDSMAIHRLDRWELAFVDLDRNAAETTAWLGRWLVTHGGWGPLPSAVVNISFAGRIGGLEPDIAFKETGPWERI